MTASAVVDVVRAWMVLKIHKEGTRITVERALLIEGLCREMEQR